MQIKKINSPSITTRVLVSPLDWGLGHTTRCIPVISALLALKCEVYIAAEGAAGKLLKDEFPQINFLTLPGYRIQFSKNSAFLSWKIASQFPKIIMAIYYERRWLKKILAQHKIQAVISDNRVGLHNKRIISAYITHQLGIKTGNIFTAAIAQRIHRYYINKFNECWVPDFEKEGLAGELSHPRHIPQNTRYIGALSRFKKTVGGKKKYDLLIILSGPEPQRTIFESLLLNDLLSFNKTALIVRGLPGDTKPLAYKKKSIRIINHLPGDSLCAVIQQSGIVISRSGYTTVMDLVKLNKNAILVPTPGQTEQEYLARYLTEKGMFFSLDQNNFNLNKALEAFTQFECVIPAFDMDRYKVVIERFLSLVNTDKDNR